ncbi:apolipoprotein A-I [Oreochromis niloticus]|uniref:Apolipoprotein A-Ib n=1 Tax=Oreochromis niloticus TaxID=8128 RepID=I3KIR4_ORENI|nr:apolipoprotein A-I [Oreochromis niloticus]
MKFVALALTLLLAVGSQAASLQADAPSQLAQIRSAVDVYLTQAKEGAIKALDQLDDTPYQEFKVILAQRLEDLHTQVKALQGSVAPVTDSVFTTVSEATAELRSNIATDIEALRTELEPKRAHLREVIDRHIEDYRSRLQPVISEYYAKHTAEMDELKTKLEPIMTELREKIRTNVEETKAALTPIVESIRARVATHVEQAKAMLAPYVEEYKEQLRQAYDHAHNIRAEDLTALRAKINPLAEDIKTKLQQIFAILSETFTKS